METLQGFAALDYLRQVTAATASNESKWTREAEEELTGYMLGLPVKPGYRFEVIYSDADEERKPAPKLRDDIAIIEKPQVIRTCLGCGRYFEPRRPNQEFHSDKCHVKASERHQAIGNMPSGWKTCAVCANPFKPERGNVLYCPRERCQRQTVRNYAKSALANRQDLELVPSEPQ